MQNRYFDDNKRAPRYAGVQAFTSGQRIQPTLPQWGAFSWRLLTEEGRQYQGSLATGEPLHLPAELPPGYHDLILTQQESNWRYRIIVAPRRCFLPRELYQGQRLWGASIQLYSLRSSSNWGVGDFGDLKRMLPEIAQRGGAFIGLNPLHALYPAAPENVSPYSPSSRHWLNILYIDVHALEDFQHNARAQAWWRRASTQRRLKAVREANWVDYSGVMALKLAALRMAWQHFSARPAVDKQREAFNVFLSQGGASLFNQGLYDTLHAFLLRQDAGHWGWPVWPEAWRQPDSPIVRAFSLEHGDEVRFWLWLQYLAADQLAECWQISRQLGMPIGLYRDLAVGASAGGAETWGDSELYCQQAYIGAPPDVLAPLGQNWGLVPMVPGILLERGAQPFIDLLRANMSGCGALRIDHVMSLLRLWWIPRGADAGQGAWVQYPLDVLLAILVLESQRQRCMVIGEDLGSVPPEIVDRLRESGVYSYRVLYFEGDGGQRFRPPEAWPGQAMAVATTHDLPTLRGYWEHRDLLLGKKLGLYPDKALFHQLYQQRERDKQGLLNSLGQQGYLPKWMGRRAARMPVNFALCRAVQCYLADSASALLGLQPEDWLQMALPVNIPGTSHEYPNWRRKLRVSLEEMFADPQVNALLKAVAQRRREGG